MSTAPSTSTTTKHKKNKSKKSIPLISESSTPASSNGPGRDPNWAFQPPPGLTAITTNEDNGEFDWDAVKNDDNTDIWLIRVPHNVEPQHLENTSLDFPSDSTAKSGKRTTNRVGGFDTKHTSYDIWSIGDSEEDVNDRRAGISHFIGGEELRSLSCLLPRKTKDGKLYLAPKPISRHLIVSAHLSKLSTSQGESALPNPLVHENPQRQRYPPELLKHRFMPYGSLINSTLRSKVDKPTSDAIIMMETDNQTPNLTLDVGEKTSKSRKKTEKATAKTKNGKNLAEANPDFEMHEIEPALEHQVEKEKKNKKRKGEDQEVSRSAKKLKKSKASTSR